MGQQSPRHRAITTPYQRFVIKLNLRARAPRRRRALALPPRVLSGPAHAQRRAPRARPRAVARAGRGAGEAGVIHVYITFAYCRNEQIRAHGTGSPRRTQLDALFVKVHRTLATER